MRWSTPLGQMMRFRCFLQRFFLCGNQTHACLSMCQSSRLSRHKRLVSQRAGTPSCRYTHDTLIKPFLTSSPICLNLLFPDFLSRSSFDWSTSLSFSLFVVILGLRLLICLSNALSHYIPSLLILLYLCFSFSTLPATSETSYPIFEPSRL